MYNDIFKYTSLFDRLNTNAILIFIALIRNKSETRVYIIGEWIFYRLLNMNILCNSQPAVMLTYKYNV